MPAAQPMQPRTPAGLAGQIGVAIVSTQHHVVWCNARCAQLLGRAAADLQGKRLEYFTHPDDVRIDAEPARRLFSGDIDTYQIVKRFLRPDQSIIWMLLSVSLVRDAHGRPLFAHAMLEPTTARTPAAAGDDPVISQIQARMFS